MKKFYYLGPGLGPYCLQRLTTSHHKQAKIFIKGLVIFGTLKIYKAA